MAKTGCILITGFKPSNSFRQISLRGFSSTKVFDQISQTSEIFSLTLKF